VTDTAPEIVFLYGLIDPRTDLCRYIGISEDPQKRLIQHKSQSTTERVQAWFAELMAEGLYPLLRIFFVCVSWTEARLMEDEWIKTLALSNDLFNVNSNPIAEKNGATPGPKPLYGENVQRYSISITPKQAALAVHLGDGNLSLGVRRALQVVWPSATKQETHDAPTDR